MESIPIVIALGVGIALGIALGIVIHIFIIDIVVTRTKTKAPAFSKGDGDIFQGKFSSRDTRSEFSPKRWRTVGFVDVLEVYNRRNPLYS